MSAKNQHIGKLIEARAQIVSGRREVAKELAKPYKRGYDDQAREAFLKMQAVIEAIDRAIEDERRSDQKQEAD